HTGLTEADPSGVVGQAHQDVLADQMRAQGADDGQFPVDPASDRFGHDRNDRHEDSFGERGKMSITYSRQQGGERRKISAEGTSRSLAVDPFRSTDYRRGRWRFRNLGSRP